jgi:uncharacterized membrane protein YeaQ/YmgE (transglycosylase-associated protein family)
MFTIWLLAYGLVGLVSSLATSRLIVGENANRKLLFTVLSIVGAVAGGLFGMALLTYTQQNASDYGWTYYIGNDANYWLSLFSSAMGAFLVLIGINIAGRRTIDL